MKSMFVISAEIIVCSGLLLAFYRLLLARSVSYAICRRYLLLSSVAAVAIPQLNIPVWPAATQYVTIPVGVTETLPPAAAETQGDWAATLSLSVYAAGVVAILAAMLRQTILAARLRRRARIVRKEHYTLAVADTESPFSFLGTVYVGENYPPDEAAQIVAHEASHVRHRHSAERIAMEAIKAFTWFNPFVWIASSMLRDIQEAQADNDVLRAGYDLTEYRMTLLHGIFGAETEIVCGFNGRSLRNRFENMTRRREGSPIRLAAALPLAAMLVGAFGFTTRAGAVLANEESPAQAAAGMSGQGIDAAAYCLPSERRISVGVFLTADMDAADSSRIIAVEADKLPQPPLKVSEKDESAKKPKKITVIGGSTSAEQPMIVIDGRAVSYDMLASVPVSSIESITVLKDGSATERYGDSGRNGVIEIKTK